MIRGTALDMVTSMAFVLCSAGRYQALSSNTRLKWNKVHVTACCVLIEK